MGWDDSTRKILNLIPQIDQIQSTIKKISEGGYKYDDSAIKAEINDLRLSLIIISDLADKLSKTQRDVLSLKRSSSSERTHNDLISNFNDRVLSLENQTDGDDEKQESIDDIIELVKSQGRKIESIADQTVEIDKLRMEIKNKDKEIAQCELHSKRAESLAKNCEQLMQNIELKISSAGVKNDN